MLPKGRLREPLDAARHADAVLWTGPTIDRLALSGQLGVQDVFSVVRDVGPPQSRTRSMGRTRLKAGQPHRRLQRRSRGRSRSIDESRAAGFEVAETDPIPRPSPVRSPRDLARVRARGSKRPSAAIALTTEKDWMRLLPLRPWPMPDGVAAHAGAHRTRRVRRVAAGAAEATRREARVVSSLRHEVDMAAVAVVRGAGARASGARSCARCGAVLGLTLLLARSRAPPRGRLTNLATAFPQRTVAERRADHARDVRPLRARAVRAAEVQHAVARADAPPGRVRRRRAGRARRTRRARACCSSRGTSATGKCRRIGARAGPPARGGAGPRARQPGAARAAGAGARVDRQLRDLPPRRRAQGAARAARPARAWRC